jgi:hypothetical protein
MQARYPNTPIFGHGEVNPGHKEADEGMTAKRAALALRAQDANAISRGAELDREREMTVTGKGHLQVDVNAPPGTRASVKGEGLLKDTSISRSTQMEPASSGPKQPAEAPYVFGGT